MDIQELYELAEQELKLGRPDPVLMKRALEEAGGVKAAARQVYWKLRSDQIAASAKATAPEKPDLFIREIKARLDAEEKGRRLRSSLIGWAWVIACFAGLAGAFVFFRAARAAYFLGRPTFTMHAISGIVCLVIGVTGFIISKRDAGQDPFA